MIGVDPRVSGTQRYSVHVERPGMLHAAFVRSPHAHARVLAVDASGIPEDCVALRFDREVLFDLLADHIELLQAMFSAVLRREASAASL